MTCQQKITVAIREASEIEIINALHCTGWWTTIGGGLTAKLKN